VNWDALEREIFILSADFSRLSKTLALLAAELQRERSFARLAVVKETPRPVSTKKSKKEGLTAEQLALF